ncbi:ester cyclase [Amycolatopsis samaneae]|uniref:Ester cyclase n=1 Tax=Amycolatopsis samaneae TaxID=664691 RepID=A0ABW5GHL2_9PSEU
MSTPGKAVLRRFLDHLNAHDLTTIDEVVADDVVESGPIVVDAPSGGIENFRTGWARMLTAFPDLRVEAETMLAEGDRVAATISLSATNTGYYRRGEATGRHATWRGFVVVRVRDGRIAEIDAQTDRFGMLRQLGIIGDDDELAAPRQAS